MRGAAWMAIGALLFSVMSLLGRVAGGHVPWLHVGAMRALVGALVAIAVAHLRRAPLRIRDKRGMWLRSVFGTASMLCTFYALAAPELPLGDAVTLFNLTPLFVGALGPFVLHERAEKAVWLALPLGLAGVAAVTRPSFLFRDAAGLPAWPTAVALLGSACAAGAMLSLRRIGPHESPEAIAVHFSLTATAVLGLLCLPTLQLPNLGDGLAMLGAGVAAGLAQLAMTRAYALEPAARISSVQYLTVAGSGALGIVFLDEHPTALKLFGMTLVVTAGILATLSSARHT